jgi:hypothetical protein
MTPFDLLPEAWQLETLLRLIDTIDDEKLEWLTSDLPGWSSTMEFWLENYGRMNNLLEVLDSGEGEPWPADMSVLTAGSPSVKGKKNHPSSNQNR